VPQARIEPHHLPPELFRGAAESPHHPYSTLHEARSAYDGNSFCGNAGAQLEHDTNSRSFGLERSHLYRKMKSLGIAAPE